MRGRYTILTIAVGFALLVVWWWLPPSRFFCSDAQSIVERLYKATSVTISPAGESVVFYKKVISGTDLVEIVAGMRISEAQNWPGSLLYHPMNKFVFSSGSVGSVQLIQYLVMKHNEKGFEDVGVILVPEGWPYEAAGPNNWRTYRCYRRITLELSQSANDIIARHFRD